MLETHLTDNEIERIKKAQEEELRKKLHLSARNEAIDRINARKAERKAIQFKANQAMGEADCEQVGDLSVQDPHLFKQLVLKRSLDFKDPNLTKKPNTQLWNSINNMPKEKLQMYVRPQILARDKQACDHIIKKMHEEEVTEAIQKQWFAQERHETRARLMRQKEKNIQAEAKAGVIKNYVPVGLSIAAQDSLALQDENGVRLSMVTSQKLSNSINPMAQTMNN